jgi:PST family polysaccharide transporter
VTLVKTSLLNSVAVGVKVASALVLNKILAVHVGPGGYAIIGQFQNAVSIAVQLAGGIFSTGVTKATAQHFDDEETQHAIWKTAIGISLCTSLLAGFIVLLTGNWAAILLLKRADLAGVFIWLGLALPAMAANNLLLAILNGKKAVRTYVTANIIGSILSLLIIGALAYCFGLYGALVAFTINPALVLFATATMVTRKEWFKAKYLWGKVDRNALRELSGFALMGLTSTMTVPVSYMLIREILANKLGLQAAGYWQASWKISEVYLMLITSTLSVYYLPRIAEIRNASEMRKEIISVYKFIVPLAIVGAITIYLLRDYIIHLLFTADFAPMKDLFPWQLAGDVVKIGAWILGYIMLGRAMVKAFVLTEIVFSLSFVVLTWLLVARLGLVGVSMAYAINYCLYFICMAFIGMYEMRQMEKIYGKS